MRKIISFLLLSVAAAPAFADFVVPEPEVISLLGVGALAFLVSRRTKK